MGKKLVPGKKILAKARKQGYAVPAFNTQNMEITQAIFSACKKEQCPVFLQITESSIKYAGLERLFNIAKFEAENTSLPVCVHLDHGHKLEYIKQALKTGFSSVMIDASKKSFEENIRITKKVVLMAKKTKASTEAELGSLGRIGETPLTDPEQAKEFVKKTRCDSLAIAVGTSHGAYKFRGKPKLDLKRIKRVSEKIKIPVVLHGASRVVPWALNQANRFGGKIAGAKGLPDRELKKAISNGISKVNIDTDLRLSLTAGIRKELFSNPKIFDPRKILGPARSLVEKTAIQKIRAMNASGKAG